MSASVGFPTVPGHWLFGSVLDLRARPLAVLEQAQRDHGPNFCLDMRLRKLFVLGHPDAIHHVLVRNAANYRDGESRANRSLKGVIGDGVLTTDGPAWARLRRNQQPAFGRQRLAPFADKIVTHVREAVDRWSGDPRTVDSLDASRRFMAMTLAIGVDVLFDYRVSEREADDVTDLLTAGQSWLWTNLFRPVPVPAILNTRVRRGTRRLSALAERVLDTMPPPDNGDPGTLLTTMHALPDSDRAELLDQIRTYLVAVPENPSNTLAWALTGIASAPEIEATLVHEIGAVLGDRDPTLDDLPALQYTARVIDEAMRLYPAAWLLDRISIDDDEVMGQRIPAGSIVLLSPLLAHRNPELWPDPDRFDPDRFLPERVAARPKHHYLPYGSGPRNCIGSRLATMILQLALPMLLRRHRYRVASTVPVTPRVGALLRPVDLRFRLEARAHVQGSP